MGRRPGAALVPQLLLCLLCLGACTVKEERNGCPCWIDLDVTGCSRFTELLRLTWWTADGRTSSEKLRMDEAGGIYSKAVVRGPVRYCAWSGDVRGRSDGTAFLIPEGSPADSIYAYCRSLDADCESVSDSVSLGKQFAVLTLRMPGSEPMEAPGASVRLTGGWQGFYLSDLSPVRGVFRCEADHPSRGVWRVCLPRQGDDSLMLDAVSPWGGDRIPIGECIAGSGYDWTAESLPDITVDIDWSLSMLTVWIEGWDTGKVYNMEI